MLGEPNFCEKVKHMFISNRPTFLIMLVKQNVYCFEAMIVYIEMELWWIPEKIGFKVIRICRVCIADYANLIEHAAK